MCVRVCVRVRACVSVCSSQGVSCYLTQLSYPGDGGLAAVLPVHRVLLEEQEDLIVLGVIALWHQVNPNEPGVCHAHTHTHTHACTHTHAHKHTERK
jgi:ABC-type nickel/cobalt efflux system permease component RcnA